LFATLLPSQSPPRVLLSPVGGGGGQVPPDGAQGGGPRPPPGSFCPGGGGGGGQEPPDWAQEGESLPPYILFFHRRPAPTPFCHCSPPPPFPPVGRPPHHGLSAAQVFPYSLTSANLLGKPSPGSFPVVLPPPPPASRASSAQEPLPMFRFRFIRRFESETPYSPLWTSVRSQFINSSENVRY
jgi:hypothetical protein